MFPRSPFRLPVRAMPLAIAALSLACSEATTPPLAPALPRDANASVGPAVIVTNTDDAGPGSLRQAIADAIDGATIQFDATIAGQTILLTTGVLSIDKPLIIEGSSTKGMTISGNASSGVFSVGDNGDVVFRNLSIVNGKADAGGGIAARGKLLLDHSLVANNEATGPLNAYGGGIHYVGDDLTLVNSTVSGNFTTGKGGGIAAFGSLTLRNSTISANIASEGGGIMAFEPVSFRNTIVADNTDNDVSDGAYANCSYSHHGQGFYAGMNLSSDASCGTDANLLVGDPMLAPLADNGGPTATHAIGLAGAAIEQGTMCGEATDQRWVARPQGRSCDIGAYEFNDFVTPTLTVGPNAMVKTKTGVATVSGTIGCSAPGDVRLEVTLSQTQKVTGRFSTIVQGKVDAVVSCLGTSSWSLVITPATGKFANGAATATATTLLYPPDFLPVSSTASIKLFAVK